MKGDKEGFVHYLRELELAEQANENAGGHHQTEPASEAGSPQDIAYQLQRIADRLEGLYMLIFIVTLVLVLGYGIWLAVYGGKL